MAVLCAICFRAVYIVEYNDRLVHVTIYVIRRPFIDLCGPYPALQIVLLVSHVIVELERSKNGQLSASHYLEGSQAGG